jgi:hypothetical protein
LDSEWREAHETLAYLFKRRGAALDTVRYLARQIRQELQPLFELFDRLAPMCCPGCETVCCLVARVEFDFKDLLLLHALDLTPPPHQLHRHEDEHCRYLGPHGCGLPRLMRPFVCTWYFCAPMLELYRREPPRTQRFLSARMSAAQGNRREMETEFIRVVLSEPG